MSCWVRPVEADHLAAVMRAPEWNSRGTRLPENNPAGRCSIHICMFGCKPGLVFGMICGVPAFIVQQYGFPAESVISWSACMLCVTETGVNTKAEGLA